MTKEMDSHNFVMQCFPRRFYKPEEHGERTKSEHPYSYSPIIVFGNETPGTTCVYDDRMYSWDSKKMQKLSKKHLGAGDFSCQSPKKVEAFLAEYFNKPNLKLHMIVEWCNVSNGYPYWSFHYTV